MGDAYDAAVITNSAFQLATGDDEADDDADDDLTGSLSNTQVPVSNPVGQSVPSSLRQTFSPAVSSLPTISPPKQASSPIRSTIAPLSTSSNSRPIVARHEKRYLIRMVVSCKS